MDAELLLSLASINDLIRKIETLTACRISERMRQRKKHIGKADVQLRCMSDLTQRRNSDANNRMMELTARMKDLTLGVKAALVQSPTHPIALHH